jgi:monoterpene epsilon-lactone hydrolase
MQSMLPTPHFRGPAKYRLRCAEVVARSIAAATARRLRHGPRMPGWNWAVELGTAILRNQLHTAFTIPNVTEQRRYIDSLVLDSPAAKEVARKDVCDGSLRGTWHTPKNPSAATILYLHGGGFAFYPKASYANLIALVARVAKASTFAVDYRLTPEHRFPAQLDDVRAAYRWLLVNGTDPRRLVVAGDSAGGNLTLALLCDLRDRGLPLPSLGIALSPATEFDTIQPSMTANENSDWITGPMALTWRDWYCSADERVLPLVSPVHADLRGLPPIYIQAGRAEILYDSICAFVLAAKQQGADITFESWPDMNHVFHFFGNDAPQSAEALRRIGEVIAQNVQKQAVAQ